MKWFLEVLNWFKKDDIYALDVQSRVGTRVRRGCITLQWRLQLKERVWIRSLKISVGSQDCWRQLVPLCFSCWAECCSAVLFVRLQKCFADLKIHMTFRQHRDEGAFLGDVFKRLSLIQVIRDGINLNWRDTRREHFLNWSALASCKPRDQHTGLRNFVSQTAASFLHPTQTWAEYCHCLSHGPRLSASILSVPKLWWWILDSRHLLEGVGPFFFI